MSWTDRAACAVHDPDLFTPRGRGGTPADWATPRAICHTCPVRGECLGAAIDEDDAWSMRGGLTPDERRALARRTTTRKESA